MTHLAARPLWVAGLTILFVCLVAPWIPLGTLRWLLYGSAAVLLLSLAIPCVRRWRLPTILALACVVATLSYLTAQNRYLPATAQVEKVVSLQVEVQPHSGDAVYLRVKSGELPKDIGLVLYNNPSDEPYEPYEILSARFQLSAFENQGLSALQSKASDIWFAVKLKDEVPARSVGNVPWTDVFYRIRRAAVVHIEQVLPKGAAAVVSGICFGEDGKLSLSAVNDFRTCGVTHLFAVSGLHMTVLAQGILFLLKKCRVPRIGQSVLATGVLWAFMMIVGLSASVVRAGVLCTLVLAGNCLRRQADSRTSLGLALILLLVSNPFAAYDVGLLLSFVSTYGLLVWSKPLQELLRRIPSDWMGNSFKKLWKTIISGTAVTVAATFATAPVLILYFGTLSLVSVPANLLIMLPAEWILILGCLATLVVPVIPFVGNALLFFCGVLAKYILWICDKIATVPFSTASLKTLPWLLWVIAVYVLLAVGWLLYRKRGVLFGAAASAVILCVLLLLGQSFSKDRLIVQTIPSATDLAAYVQFDGYRTLVLSVSSSDTLEATAAQLKKQGVSRLDALIFIGGKTTVIAELPNILAEAVTEKTQCVYANGEVPFTGFDLSNTAARFGENGSLVFHNGFLQMTVGENCVVFAGNEMQREQLPLAFENTPLLFSAGKVEILYSNQEQELPKGSVLQQPLPVFVLEKDKVWYKRR